MPYLICMLVLRRRTMDMFPFTDSSCTTSPFISNSPPRCTLQLLLLFVCLFVVISLLVLRRLVMDKFSYMDSSCTTLLHTLTSILIDVRRLAMHMFPFTDSSCTTAHVFPSRIRVAPRPVRVLPLCLPHKRVPSQHGKGHVSVHGFVLHYVAIPLQSY
jgi:hypothetical protein